MVRTTAQKLGIQPAMRVRREGTIPEVASDHLGQAPEYSAVDHESEADIIILYAETLDDVGDRAGALFKDVTPGGRLWIAYRKGATKGRPASQGGSEPLHRDSLQRALAAHRLEGVTLIALDDTWSAMRVKRAKDARTTDDAQPRADTGSAS